MGRADVFVPANISFAPNVDSCGVNAGTRISSRQFDQINREQCNGPKTLGKRKRLGIRPNGCSPQGDDNLPEEGRAVPSRQTIRRREKEEESHKSIRIMGPNPHLLFRLWIHHGSHRPMQQLLMGPTLHLQCHHHHRSPRRTGSEKGK